MTPANPAPDDPDLWGADPTACPTCGRESCEGHIPVDGDPPLRLDPEGLADVTQVIAEGRAIATNGIRYRVDGIIPNYGILGFSVAYTKVGKTTFGQALANAVAQGADFLNRATAQARVLVIAAEDPPEYTAWLARNLNAPAGSLTFYRRPVRLDADGLTRIENTIREDGYGLVLIASWQSVIAGLLKHEDDNAAAVVIVEHTKTATRTTGIPWLIDAHSGKREDQSDDADPTKALRGASSAAGAADFVLSLRYGNGAFGTQRRLSGKGRFVSFPPLLLDYTISTGTFTALGDTKSAQSDSTWQIIIESGVLADWASVDAIAMAIRMVSDKGKPTSTHRRRINAALHDRPGLDRTSEARRGQTTTLYRLAPEEFA